MKALISLSGFSMSRSTAGSQIRWGLCCQFLDAPIRFRTATHRFVDSLEKTQRRVYLAGIAGHNADALLQAIEHCHANGIGAFRVNSQVLPLATHPVSGYQLEEIDPTGEIHRKFLAARAKARQLHIRLSFHPDQFVVLNSERADVVISSIGELEHQARVAELVGADTVVLHGGSSAGGKAQSIDRLARTIEKLSPAARTVLALENDDRRFAPADLLPLCRATGVPLVYDVHHHRCHPDGLSIAEATRAMMETWSDREPWAHISSPRDGWGAPDARPHAAFIDPVDFPEDWKQLPLTVDVEAKEKERAVLALMRSVNRVSPPPAGTPGKKLRPGRLTARS
jgi:UV DNA damage endonuclease